MVVILNDRHTQSAAHKTGNIKPMPEEAGHDELGFAFLILKNIP